MYSSTIQLGQQGGTGNAATGERTENGNKTADSAGGIESDSRQGRTSETYSVSQEKEINLLDPRTMSEEEKQRRGDMLRNAPAIDVKKGVITSTPELSARKAAEKCWDENVNEPALYDTEAGEVEINRNSIESSLAHRYGQKKLDAITSLIEGFENAVYLGTMPDSRERGIIDHYFAYPIMYDGELNFVFCRAMQDANKNRLYVHEVFVGKKIKKGDTLQTAASKPHGGISLYRDILANVLETPEQSSLLERPNFAQYTTEQELSNGKGTTKTETDKEPNEKFGLRTTERQKETERHRFTEDDYKAEDALNKKYAKELSFLNSLCNNDDIEEIEFDRNIEELQDKLPNGFTIAVKDNKLAILLDEDVDIDDDTLYRFIDGISADDIYDELSNISSFSAGAYNLIDALENYYKGELISGSGGAKYAIKNGLVPVPGNKYSGLNEEYHHFEFRDAEGNTFVEAVPFVNAENVESDFDILFNASDSKSKGIYRSDEAIKNKIEELFNQAISGDFKGKPISIGRLTDEGKAYLEHISGIVFKDKVDFVLNPSDLVHINKGHFGNNETDERNIPLDIEDIRSIADVVSFPDRIIYAKENAGEKRKMFFFLKEAENGTYNLLEIYADKKGNLTAKTFYKTKEGVSQRAMTLSKSLHTTSETDGATLYDAAKIPKMFESASVKEKILLVGLQKLNVIECLNVWQVLPRNCTLTT